MSSRLHRGMGIFLVAASCTLVVLAQGNDASHTDATRTADIVNLDRRITRLEHDQDQRSDRLQTLIWGLLGTSVLNLVAGEWRRRSDGSGRKRSG